MKNPEAAIDELEQDRVSIGDQPTMVGRLDMHNPNDDTLHERSALPTPFDNETMGYVTSRTGQTETVQPTIEKSEKDMTVLERVEKARAMTGKKIVRLFHVSETSELQLILKREELDDPNSRWQIVTDDQITKHYLRTTSMYFESKEKEKDGLNVLPRASQGGLEDLEVRVRRHDYKKEGPLKVRLPAPTNNTFDWAGLAELKRRYGPQMDLIPHRDFTESDYADFSAMTKEGEEPQKAAETRKQGGTMQDLEARLAKLKPGETLKIKLPEPSKARARWQELLELEKRYGERIQLVPFAGHAREDYRGINSTDRTDEMPALQMHQPETRQPEPEMTKVDYMRLIEHDHLHVQSLLGRAFTITPGNTISVRLLGEQRVDEFAKTYNRVATNAKELGRKYNIYAISVTVMDQGKPTTRIIRLAPPKAVSQEAQKYEATLNSVSAKLGGPRVSQVPPSKTQA